MSQAMVMEHKNIAVITFIKNHIGLHGAEIFTGCTRRCPHNPVQEK